MDSENALHLLGVTRCYKGFKHTAYAISLVVEDESCLESVTKRIYEATAAHFGCSWTSVERNIRTATARAWQVNSKLLAEMAGYPLINMPTSSEFIEIISSYLLRTHQNRAGMRPVKIS